MFHRGAQVYYVMIRFTSLNREAKIGHNQFSPIVGVLIAEQTVCC